MSSFWETLRNFSCWVHPVLSHHHNLTVNLLKLHENSSFGEIDENIWKKLALKIISHLHLKAMVLWNYVILSIHSIFSLQASSHFINSFKDSSFLEEHDKNSNAGLNVDLVELANSIKSKFFLKTYLSVLIINGTCLSSFHYLITYSFETLRNFNFQMMPYAFWDLLYWEFVSTVDNIHFMGFSIVLF